MDNKLLINRAKEFEKEYFPCAKEWWCIEVLFTTKEDNKKWTLRGDFYQAIGHKRPVFSVYSASLFDLDEKKTYFNNYFNPVKLDTKKDKFEIKFEDAYIKGAYPDYETYIFVPAKDIHLNLKYHAESLPYWVAQQSTNGWLPWIFGYYRYGFIPNNKVEGTLKIHGKKFALKGHGYFEHIFGDFSFIKENKTQKSFKKTISIYTSLIGNWIRKQRFQIPRSIMFGTDNRAPGYDWLWAVLDNNWSIFFGNMMLWIMEGPTTGTLILTKDGINYEEFSDIYFRYNKMKYLKEYDFYYPLELEIIAKKGNELLHFKCKNITDGFEDITKLKKVVRFGFTICQVPIKLEGYYKKGDEKIDIKSFAKMEFHRTVRASGHNTLKLSVDIAKNSFGFYSRLDSHIFRKKADITLRLLPKPNFKVNLNKIDLSKLK